MTVVPVDPATWGTFLEVPETQYRADPALSQSTAKLLLAPWVPATALWQQTHPSIAKDVFDFGTSVHSMVLGCGSEPVDVGFGDWRTKGAREAREETRTAGRTPLLSQDYAAAAAAAAAVRDHQIAGKLLEPGTFLPERSVWWEATDTGVTCRARLDAVKGHDGNGPLLVVDLKTTSSCATAALSRSTAQYGHYQQDPWYRDAVEAVCGERPPFVFVFVEKEPPHLVRVVQLDDTAYVQGLHRNTTARRVWAECISTGVFPGYPLEIETLTLPRWALM